MSINKSQLSKYHFFATEIDYKIQTNNKKIYHIAKMLRSHGMVREIGDKEIKIAVVVIIAQGG